MLAILLAAPATAPPNEPIAPVVRPLFELDRGRAEIVWTREGDRELEAVLTLRNPVLRIVRRTEEPSPPPGAPPLPGTGEIVREASPVPIEVDRLAIHDGAVLFVDETVPGRELLRIHGLELLVENFSTEREGSHGMPMLVAARGRIGREGRIAAFATFNVWTGELDFAGRAQVAGLRLEEIAALVEERFDLRPTGGTLTAFVEFSVHDGRITGAVKPFLTNVDVAAADPGFFDALEAWVAELGIELVSEDVRGGETLATVVPIRGRLRQPEPGLWDAFVGVLANAFLEALTVGFEGMPPPTGAS